MAISLISLLKVVPWADVISTAPVVAEGAKKLWKATTKKSTPPAKTDASALHDTPQTATTQQTQLQTQLTDVTARCEELERQMHTSSELIQALADQNTALIERALIQAQRLRWLSAAVLLLALVVALGFWLGLRGAV